MVNQYYSTKQLSLIEMKTPKEIFRDLRNYLAGQLVGATRDEILLDEILKCLFCKLYIEMGLASVPGSHLNTEEFSLFIKDIFLKIKKDFPDIYEPQSKIILNDRAIGKIIFDCSFSMIDSRTDVIGDVFEVFVGSESKSRSGQFFTPRSVTDLLVEALAPQPEECIIDPACGAGGFLNSVVRYWLNQDIDRSEITDIIKENLFGIDKDAYLANLAKLHISLLTGGHPNILCGDSLALKDNLPVVQDKLDRGGFDVVFANPPFGSRIVAADTDVLHKFKLARKWKYYSDLGKWLPTNDIKIRVPPQVLFVERCLSLLKEGGRMGIILPESLLSNKSYRYIVQYLLEKTKIKAVIGMPEALFKTSGKGGTHTKTCILIAEKTNCNLKTNYKIFMAEAKWCGQDSRARNISKNDLPEIKENLINASNNSSWKESHLGFSIDSETIKTNVLCPRYYDPGVSGSLKSLEKTHDLFVFGELIDRGIIKVATGDELGKMAYGTGDIPFIRTSDISNWELKADPKHGVSREIFESMRVKQDVRMNDILMVKDGTYLIGTCAIVTEYDLEIVYQSHLYKIRVLPNKIDLNPFLLLAVLSSPIVHRQIKSKQFTQDIIDSLGERLHELVLPIPKSGELRDEITEMVKTVIKDRVEARELAKKARLAVAGL